MRIVDAAEAVSVIESGHKVYVHEVAMTPATLLDALAPHAQGLTGVEVFHLHIEGPAPHLAPSLVGKLHHNAFFVGANARAAIREGRADYLPVFLSDVPRLLTNGTLPIDVALIQVSPPDAHGFCRLGTSIACARAAVETARIVIAEFNPHVPQTSGHSSVHVSRIHAAVNVDRPLPLHLPPKPSKVETEIGKHVASLIPNGATLQLGIGAIPNAVLAALRNHEDLGVHTEMFSDGLLDLIDAGVISNRKKSRFKGRVITSFALGSKRLYEYVDKNPFVEFHPIDVVNDTDEIRRQYRMMAINSAIEVDFTGQVCADSIGPVIYSGIGGQMDFMQGAACCAEGKAIIALPSTACKGTRSRIVPSLAQGAGVVTTRGHVQYVVTEYGAVELRGRNIRQRAELLISIAHPDFRGELQRTMRSRPGWA